MLGSAALDDLLVSSSPVNPEKSAPMKFLLDHQQVSLIGTPCNKVTL